MMDSNIILSGNVMEQLRKVPDGIVQTCITSPPYWGLRDYKIPPQIWDGDVNCKHEFFDEEVTGELRIGLGMEKLSEQYRGGGKKAGTVENITAVRGFCIHCNAWRGSLGLEPTPELFVQHIVQVFREVRRVLRDDGTIWVNLGDSYANDTKWDGSSGGKHVKALHGNSGIGRQKVFTGLKPKDLVGIPWMVAFALRADGWYLRSDIIWFKPNPMPESVTDRPTKSHEYLFLLSKSKNYYYDADAIKEKSIEDNWNERLERESLKSFPDAEKNGIRSSKKLTRPAGWATGSDHSAIGWATEEKQGRGHKNLQEDGQTPNTIHLNRTGHQGGTNANGEYYEKRNKRTVWTVATQPYKEAHFATYPEALITPCILAGAPVGGIVLDPFFGSGTTGAAAKRFGRKYIGIELSEEYIKLAERRIGKVPENLFANVPGSPAADTLI